MRITWTAKKATRLIVDPITGNTTRVPAHIFAPERMRGDQRQWIEAKGYQA